MKKEKNVLSLEISSSPNDMYQTPADAPETLNDHIDSFLACTSEKFGKSRKSDFTETIKIGSKNIGLNSTTSTQTFVGKPYLGSKKI